MIPESLNPCVRKDGELITREILENNLYEMIEKVQGEDTFYIPSPEEILDYTENGYPTADPFYGRLKSFLTGTLRLEEERAEELLEEWFGTFFGEYITEWNSNAYIPVDVLGLCGLHNLAEKGNRWHQASEKALDVIFPGSGAAGPPGGGDDHLREMLREGE